MVTCYCCGRAYSTASLPRHLSKKEFLLHISYVVIMSASAVVVAI
jgi:hypothetical protein